MRFTISSAVALLAAAATTVSALEQPLDIEVTKAVSCDRKTKAGIVIPFLLYNFASLRFLTFLLLDGDML